MRNINIYIVKTIQKSEDIELEPAVINYQIAANTIKEVIDTLTDDKTGVCKESNIVEIIYDKTIYAYKYL